MAPLVLGWAERTTPERHPWRTTSRTVPYVPYTCLVRPVQLGQLRAQLLTNNLYLANHFEFLHARLENARSLHTKFYTTAPIDTCSRNLCREPSVKKRFECDWIVISY
jgi:hypothetical protein